LLVAVPNVSEGRDEGAMERMQGRFAPALVLDIHADPDHGRSVYTLAAPQGELSSGLVSGAAAAIEAIDLARHEGAHPFVGALDVMPVVYLDEGQRGPACAEALTAAGRIGAELEVPVFLYGELATRPEHRERAGLRASPGGLAAAGRADEGW
jgi:glutamate formiminotransferase / 5-formyltetrahydrofolate cyclo-ligase